MNEAIVLDITRAHAGTEIAIVENVLRDTQRGIESCIILGTVTQLEALRARWASGLTADTVGALAPAFDVLRWLADPAHLVSVARLYVFSFHREVLDCPETLARSRPGLEVVTQPLGRFTPRAEAVVSAAWPPNFVPIDEAARLLGDIVEHSVGGLQKTSVRTLLEARDARFNKAVPGANTPRLISLLVDRAVELGYVVLHAGHESNPTLLPAGSNPTNSHDTQGADDTALTDPEPNVVVTSDTGGRSPTSGGPTATSNLLVKETAAAPSTTDSGRTVTRSRAYLEILRSAGLGYGDVRHPLYDELEAAVKDEPGLPLGIQIDRALERVRADWEAQNQNRPYAWRGARDSLENLLSAVPVALDHDGVAFGPTWAGSRKVVCGFTDDWRLRLEGELVVRLVRGGAEVRQRDIRDLAGALKHDRSSDSVQAVLLTVSLLLDEGQLMAQTPDGLLTLPIDEANEDRPRPRPASSD